MELIDILRWIVELGRLDMMVDVSLLSSHSMQPRQGHLDQVFHVFGYLKRNKRATLMFDESRVNWDKSAFENMTGQISTGMLERKFPQMHPNILVTRFRLIVLLMPITRGIGLRGDLKQEFLFSLIAPQ
jgi:hypothetical protein